MSLEINSLDYEIDHIPQEGETKLNPSSGLVDFDPQENVLIFYDLEKKEQKFLTQIKEIKLIDSYLNEDIIAFEQEISGKKYEIKISKPKLDTLSNRSFKILLENIQSEFDKKEKKQNRVFNDIITQPPKSYQKSARRLKVACRT